jgi:hypothetical protein
MRENKSSPSATSPEPCTNHSPEGHQAEESGRGLLFKAIFWFILFPGAVMVFVKWVLDL